MPAILFILRLLNDAILKEKVSSGKEGGGGGDDMWIIFSYFIYYNSMNPT